MQRQIFIQQLKGEDFEAPSSIPLSLASFGVILIEAVLIFLGVRPIEIFFLKLLTD